MSPESAFVAAYALVLLAVAAGLRRLGKVNSSPWASRALAGYRAQTGDHAHDEERAAWPHSEVPRLFAGLAAVASTAAMVLCVAEMVRNHNTVDVLVLGIAAALSGIVTSRLVRAAFPR
jgi:phosphatidylserine synthase